MATPNATITLALDGSTRKLDPRARTRWAMERSLFWVLIGLALVIGGVIANLPELVFGGIAGTLVLVGLAVVSASLSYHFWSWSAHDDAIELSHGVVMRKLSVVPYHRIQQIDIARGPVERILGIATLVLRSAAATTDAKLPGIALDHSEQLRHALLSRAGVDDAV